MKILVIGPSWIGDMMLSQSLYRTILSEYPESIIDVMAPSWSISLLSRMPQVNDSILIPLNHGSLALGKRIHIGKYIGSRNYDRAYILPNSFKSALIPFFSRIKRRIGWRGEMRYGLLNDMRILDKVAFPLMVERYVALGYDYHIVSSQEFPHPLLLPQLKVNADEQYNSLTYFSLTSNRPIIGLCIGAEFSLKQWPHYHHVSLAEKLINEGNQIIILGSKKDQKNGNTIIQQLSKSSFQYCKNLTGRTSLEQAIILLSKCKGVVSNDSGLMHIAAALNCSLIALYGPSSHEFTPPLSNRARIIHLDYHSKGEYLRKHNYKNETYHPSLIHLHPSYVYNSLNELLNSSGKSICMY